MDPLGNYTTLQARFLALRAARLAELAGDLNASEGSVGVDRVGLGFRV